MIQFRGFSPPERDTLVQALGSQITVQESPWECWNPLAINHEKKPFDDRRVRRALSLALDRYQGAAALARLTILREVSGVQGVGTAVRGVPGRARDAGGLRARHREVARGGAAAPARGGRAGWVRVHVQEPRHPNPYEALGIWLADQWRQIGLNVKIETLELGTLYSDIRAGRFEVAADFHCSYIVEPDLALFKFQSTDLSPVNYSRYVDRTLDALYEKQSRTADREERRRHIRDFERRLLDEEAHYIYTLPVASHRPAQRARAGLDDHAEPLPEQSARHGVAGGVSGASAHSPSTARSQPRPRAGSTRDRERVDSTHRPSRDASEHHTLYLLPGGFFRAPSPRPSGERNTI